MTIEEQKKKIEEAKKLAKRFPKTGAAYDVVTLSAAETDMIRYALEVCQAVMMLDIKDREKRRAAEDEALAYTE